MKEVLKLEEGDSWVSVTMITHTNPDWTEICELEGNGGSPKLLLKICKLAEQKATSRIIVMINFDNPRLSSLIKLYKRFGAEPTYVMMEKEVSMNKIKGEI